LSTTTGSMSARALEKHQWLRLERGSIVLHQSPLLARYSDLLEHAFTTRLGGSSASPMSNFNLGRHIDDELIRQDAMKNRQSLCEALNVDHERLVVPGQVHSPTIVTCADVPEKGALQNVDAVATNSRTLPVLLHFADCVPVILFDPMTMAIAVIHAGWRGTASMIVKNGAKELTDKFGAKPGNIKAAIGPAISSCCYPTSVEAAAQLAQTVTDASSLIITEPGEQPRPDLKAINAMQLLESGVGEVDVTDLCTACLPDLFYSHRQSGGKTGRQGAIAMLKSI
jgi:YfiH family protein